MTISELQLVKSHAVVVCALLIMRLDDAYPEIGWGMHPVTAIDTAIGLLGYNPADLDLNSIEADVIVERAKYEKARRL